MSTPSDDSEPVRQRELNLLRHTAAWIVPAYALLFLSLVVDRLDPGSEPWFDLTGTLALVAWVFAESGQTLGIVVIATALIAVMVTRPGLSRRTRITEFAVMAVVSIVVLYGGSLVNSDIVKPAVGVARPSIVLLDENDALGMDVDAFYDLSKEDRSAYLDDIKTETGFGDIAMRSEVRDHWVKETAFSRPSGHALASMTFATLYVSVALAWLTGPRRRPFLALAPWAVIVSLSRPLLRVHWPADILIGGLAGIVIGAAAYLFTEWSVQRLDPAHRRENVEAYRPSR